MSLFTVPLSNALPWYKFKITLSGAIFVLNLRYNGRMDRWMMDILDSSGNQILCGLPLLINRNITGQYRTLQIPAGVFFTTDDTGKDVQPTLYSFGIDKTFWYEDPTQ